MKKLLLTLAIISICLPVQAIEFKEIVDKLPPMNQGIGYSIIEGGVTYLTTTPVFNKGRVNLEVGYASKEAVIGVLSYKALQLGDYTDIPILKEIEPNVGVYYGFKHINQMQGESDYGISLTLLDVKF